MFQRYSSKIATLVTAVLIVMALSAGRPSWADVQPGVLQPNDLIVNGGVIGSPIGIYSGIDGSYKGELISGDVAPWGRWGITLGPDGNLYLGDTYRNSVRMYNGTTGVYLGDFITSGLGGLAGPVAVDFMPDGNLYVVGDSAAMGPGVFRYNGTTGAFIDVPITSATPNIGFPQDVVWGADGNLYISCAFVDVNVWPQPGAILRYNPITGITDTFVQPGSGGLTNPRQFAFGPDGNLYVTSQNTGSIKRYNGKTGAYIDDFVSGDTSLLYEPLGLAFGPDGNLYVTSGTAWWFTWILRFDGATGRYIDQFTTTVNQSATYLLFNRGVTHAGTSVAVSPVSTATIAFDSVSAPGQTSVLPLNSDFGNIPANIQVGSSTAGIPSYFDITTTASFQGPVAITIAYDPTQFRSDQNPAGPPPQLLHFQNGAWVDVSTSFDPVAHTVSGSVSSFSPFAVASEGTDTTPPKIFASNASAVATSSTGSSVSFSPYAVDPGHGSVPVICSPASGSVFPLGATTVNCAATDGAGNQARSTFQVNVTYDWSGVLSPIKQDGTSVFRLGSTVPVKFQLTGASAGVTNAVANLSYQQVGTTNADPNVAVSTSPADTGNQFRYDATSRQYVFNMSTKGLVSGSKYTLSIDLHDGIERKVVVGLR